MTSNIGTELIGVEDSSNLKQKIHERMKVYFRPEFLNRIDEIVVFNHLKKEDVKRIIDIQLRGLGTKLAKRNIILEVEDEVRDYLAREGFDPVYGARYLKRLIQRKIQDTLSLQLLKGSIKDGDKIVAQYKNGSIIFRKEEEKQER